MRKNFDRRKKALHQDIDEMLQLLGQMLRLVDRNLKMFSSEDLDRLSEMEDSIDDMEEQAYHRCIQLISLEQPVASDLRYSIGILKLLGDLERIGDHTLHLMKSLQKNESIDQKSAISPICLAMSTKLQDMFRDTAKAIQELNPELATQVIAGDEELDEQHKQFIHENIKGIHQTPELADAFINLLFLSRFLERIGDRLCNVCRWVIYIKKGIHPD